MKGWNKVEYAKAEEDRNDRTNYHNVWFIYIYICENRINLTVIVKPESNGADIKLYISKIEIKYVQPNRTNR